MPRRARPRHPTAVAVGTGIGARHNILIKDAATLEGIGALDAIALDKTGTLTVGEPAATDLIALDDELLRLVAGAEQGSEHALAAAIIRAARQRGLQLADTDEFEAVAGHGLTAPSPGAGSRSGTPACCSARGSNRAD